MKNDRKFLLTVITILLASTLILTGCMYTVVSDKNDPQTYVLETLTDLLTDSLTADSENAPPSQSDIKKKFDIYTYSENRQVNSNSIPSVIEQNGVRYFSEEQAEELYDRRNRGEMFTLTYDEILFIINDSINQYFANDYIVLTNALDYGFVTSPETLVNLSPGSYTIECYQGDYSEFVGETKNWYDLAVNKYELLLADILDIIVYRLVMLDTTFVKVNIYEYNDALSDDPGISFEVEGSSPVLMYKKTIAGSVNIVENYYDHPPISSFSWFKYTSYSDGITRNEYLQSVNKEVRYYFKLCLLEPVRNSYNPFPFQSSFFEISNRIIDFIDHTKSVDENVGYLFPTSELKSMKLDKAELMKKVASREAFERFTKDIYPEYDLSRPTEILPIKYYQYGKDGNGGIKIGMSYKELVDTFGIPYDSHFSGMFGGCYITEKADIITVYFGYDGETYSVTGTSGISETSKE